jgi:hypothetical protein
LWNCYLYGSDLDRANEVASELLAAASDKDGYQRLEAHHAMWTTKINLGRPAESIEHLECAPLLYDAANHSKWRIYAFHDPLVCSHSMGAIAHWGLGNFDRARRLAAEGVRVAMQVDHPLTRVIATMQAALVFFQCGDADSTRRHAESAMSFGQGGAFSPWRERAAVTLARLMVDENAIDEGVQLLEENFSIAMASSLMLSGTLALLQGAEIYARAGQPKKGLDLLGTLRAEQLSRRFCEPEFHRLYAELSLVCSPCTSAEAESRLRTAITLAQERQLKALELRAALSLARLLAPRDRAAARDALAVVDWFTEGADVADLRNARALRDELH